MDRILFVLTIISLVNCAPKQSITQPNLLYIFGDQHRRQALGFLGQDPVITPNLDELAKGGVYFSRAVANHPLCSPYRAMFITGQYPQTNGVIANCHSGRTSHGNFLDTASTATFTDVLSQNGYDAGFIGKWHLEGPTPTPEGTKNIWDSYTPSEHRHGMNFWYAYNADNDHFKPHYWNTFSSKNEPEYVNKWSPSHEAEIIMEYLEGGGHAPRDLNKPFSLIWSINPPHTPFGAVPDKYKELYEGKSYQDVLNRPNVSYTNNTELKVGSPGVEKQIYGAPDYFAAVTGIDDQIGRVIRKLKELGLYENTIIVYSADHGEMLGSQGLMHKNVWYKESLEIPLIVHFPKALTPKTDELLISVPDYMPTLLGLMGLEDKIPGVVEGKNYAPYLLGKPIEKPDHQFYYGSLPSDRSSGKRGFRTNEHTFASVKLNDGSKNYYLYDDLNDPYQMINLWGTDVQQDSSFLNRLNQILKYRNDPWLN